MKTGDAVMDWYTANNVQILKPFPSQCQKDTVSHNPVPLTKSHLDEEKDCGQKSVGQIFHLRRLSLSQKKCLKVL